jgi:hypothetical protein
MSNQQLLGSFTYSLTLLVILIIGGMWMLIQRIKVIEDSVGIESMCGTMNPYANTAFRNGMGYQQTDTGTASQPGVSKFGNALPDSSSGCGCSDGFFGGGEPPVFYDIGDVRAARSTRGWSTGYATNAAGDPIYDSAGNPVLASKASDYKSAAARSAVYGGVQGGAYSNIDAKMRAAGYTRNSNNEWVTDLASANKYRKKESMWSKATEGLWAPVSTEGYTNPSDEDLMYRR